MNLNVNVFKRCEIVLNSTKTYENPFLGVDIDAVFTHESGRTIKLPGFWNGGNEWKVRFSPDLAGEWKYTVACSDPDNASLTDAGVITAVAAEPATELEKHGYVTIPANSRYLTYADGKPFFYLADTHWQMPDYERMDECNYPGCTCGNQFKHLADDRIKKGFTVYQTYFDSAESDGGGNKRRNHWWKDYYTVINPEAFNESMDVMIEYLANHGMTVAMGFGVHSSTISKMTRAGSLETAGVAIRAFAKYCVARYACYPVMWITAQEITVQPEIFAIWRTVGETVGKYDGYNRPNGAHMYPMGAQDERAQLIDNTDWHQWWTLQAGHGGVGRLQPRSFYESYRKNKTIKPYLETECHYEDIYCGGFCGHDASRIGAWQALMSGCAGFTYGVTGVWAMEWNATDDRGWLSYSPEPWYIGMDKPGSTEMTYLRKFFEYVDWTTLEPVFGFDFGAFEMRKLVSIAHRGQDVLIYYFFSFEAETGVIDGLKPGVKYQMRWYDPVNGKFVDMPDVVSENGKMLVPKKPNCRDWVLLLNDVYLGEYETEPYPAAKRPLARAEAKPGEAIKFDLWTSSENPEHPAKNLTDDNEDTYFTGLAPCTSQTFIFDMGEKQHVSYLQIMSKMPEWRFVHFRVYGSDDRETWTPIVERPNDCVGIGGEYKDYMEQLDGEYRYIKLFINSFPIGSSNFEITKLGLYK